MKTEELQIVRGSGNVFRDFGLSNPDVWQLKSVLASRIIDALDSELLTVRAAEARTGIAAADFSRIRNADLKRFTVDRLISTLNRLGYQIDFTLTVKHTPESVSKRIKGPSTQKQQNLLDHAIGAD